MLVALRSRRHIAPFSVLRPYSVAETLTQRDAPGSCAFLAGGIDLIDWMKHGNAVDRLIRLDGIPGLADITFDNNALRIGAMARHAAIAESAVIETVLPDFSTLWNAIANPRVRFAGTIGGNVMAGHPDYDALPALMALDAQAEIATASGTDLVPVSELPGLDRPLVTGFVITAPRTRRLLTDRSLRPALTVFLGVADGQARIAVGMAHEAPVCVTLPSLDATDAVRLLPEPKSDGRASGAYRRRMVGVLTRRLIGGIA